MGIWVQENGSPREIGKVWVQESGQPVPISKIWIQESNGPQLIYNAELVIYDNGTISGYTPEKRTQANAGGSFSGYHIDFVAAASTIGSDYLRVTHKSTYASGNDWYSENGCIRISGINTTGYTKCYVEYYMNTNNQTFPTGVDDNGANVVYILMGTGTTTDYRKSGTNSYYKANIALASGTTTGTVNFNITAGTNQYIEFQMRCMAWNQTGNYCNIKKIWFE